MAGLKAALGKAQPRASSEVPPENSRKDDAFRLRVAQQQFMNAHGSIFQSLARRGKSADDAADSMLLQRPAEAAKKLSSLVASLVLQKPAAEIDPVDIRPFRPEAASIVAAAMDLNREVDPEAFARQIAMAVSLADPQVDINVYERMNISSEASVLMTAASITAQIMKQVMLYDFRQNQTEFVSVLLRAVMDATAAASREMIAPEASDNDRRTLLQTLGKHLGGLMEACYERKARMITARLADFPEGSKAAFFESYNPAEDIIKEFKAWAVCFAGFATFAAKATLAASKSSPERDSRP